MAAALAPLVLLSLRDCSNILSCSDSSTWYVDITVQASGCGDWVDGADWVIRGQTGDGSSWCCSESSDSDYYGYATVKFCPDVTVGTVKLWIWESDGSWPSCGNTNPPSGWSDSGNDCKSYKQITIPRLATEGYSTSWSDEGGTKYIGVSAPKGNIQTPTAYPAPYPTRYPTAYPAPTPPAPTPNAPTPPAPTPNQGSGLCPSRVPGISPGAPTVEAVSCGQAACRAVTTVPVGQEFGLCDPCIAGPIAGVTLKVSSTSSDSYTLQITQTIGGYSQSESTTVQCGKCVEIDGFSAEIPCSSGGDSGVPVGAIVGAVVGVLVLIGLVVGVVFFLRWRQGQVAKATGVATGLDLPLTEAKGQYTEMGSTPGAVHQGQSTEMGQPCYQPTINTVS